MSQTLLIIEDLNHYLQKSHFRPTAEYEMKLRQRAFSKLIKSTMNARIKNSK
nr:hypothetical protein [Lentilactobacillus sp. SPB1-3]MCZ0978024.1 hypothetical protein [Lentilactobacillus sp. SPB1-3]